MSTIREVIITNPNGEDDKAAQINITNTSIPFVLKNVATIGEKYTFSAWVMSDAPFTIKIAEVEIPVSNKWERQKVTFIADSKDVKIYFKNTGVYYLHKSQLEIGNVMTDWAMSPLDVEEELNKTNAKLELKVNKDTLISEINASADIIRISGNRLVIDSTYFTVSEDGTVEASNMTIKGKSTFLSESNNSSVQIANGRIDVFSLTEVETNPVMRFYLNDELKGQIQYTGVYGYGEGKNKYPFVGSVELSDLKVGGSHLYDSKPLEISVNDDSEGYAVTRATYDGMSSCLLATGVVVVNERIQIKTAQTIEAGEKIILGTVDEERFWPKSMIALSVYNNSSNTRRWNASINSDGEIVARPSSSMSKGYTYTLYLAGVYSIGETIGNIVTNVPGVDTGDDGGTVIVLDGYTVPSQITKGAEAECSVIASSSIGADLFYQWYYKNYYSDGSYETNFRAAENGSSDIWNAQIVANSTISKRAVYCVIRDTENHTFTTTTKEMQYVSSQMVEITSLSSDTTVNEGERFTLSVTAKSLLNGVSITGYQWESSYGTSESWQELSGGNSASYTSTAPSVYFDTNYYFRCKIKLSNSDYVYTDDIKVAVKNATDVSYTITNNLSNVSISNNMTSIGAGESYSAKLTPNESYGISSVKVTMGGTDVTSSVYSNGVITIDNVTGDIVITASAVKAISINSQPQSKNIEEGGVATFSVSAESLLGLSLNYQWQESEDNGASWKDKLYNTSSSLTMTGVSMSYNGRKYRCKVSDANGNVGYSSAATLTVYEATVTPTTKITIKTHPVNQRVKVGTSAVFSILATTNASGATLSYLWQFSDNNGASWNNVSNHNKEYIAVNISNVSYSGRLYRCIVSDGVSESVTSNSAVLELYDVPTYSVTNSLTNVSTSNSATSAKEGSSYSATLTADDGYVISYITIRMYDEQNNPINITNDAWNDGSIYISNVTGDISIQAIAEKEESGYTITYRLTNCTSSNSATTIAEGDTLRTTIVPDAGYSFEDMSIGYILMGGNDLTPYNDYINYATGELVIPNVDGDINIMIKFN